MDAPAGLVDDASPVGVRPPFRLAWRVLTKGGATLPRYLVLSDDLADGDALRERARHVADEAFGAEFRVGLADGRFVYSTLLEIDRWDPARRDLPPAVATTLWEHGSGRGARATALRHALRLALEGGVADGLLEDADALGLRRAADLIIDGRLAA